MRDGETTPVVLTRKIPGLKIPSPQSLNLQISLGLLSGGQMTSPWASGSLNTSVLKAETNNNRDFERAHEMFGSE